MGKRESPKSEIDTGVSVLGAFKLNLLQHVKLILFQKFTTAECFLLSPAQTAPVLRLGGGRQTTLTFRKMRPKTQTSKNL